MESRLKNREPTTNGQVGDALSYHHDAVLTQGEADDLIAIEKDLTNPAEWQSVSFPFPSDIVNVPSVSVERREPFLLD